MDKKLVDYILETVTKQAHKVRNDASLAGRHNDGGCIEMLNKLHYFQCGLEGKLPTPYLYIADNFHRIEKEKVDPEFQEFLRLKQKFNQ